MLLLLLRALNSCCLLVRLALPDCLHLAQTFLYRPLAIRLAGMRSLLSSKVWPDAPTRRCGSHRWKRARHSG